MKRSGKTVFGHPRPSSAFEGTAMPENGFPHRMSTGFPICIRRYTLEEYLFLRHCEDRPGSNQRTKQMMMDKYQSSDAARYRVIDPGQ